MQFQKIQNKLCIRLIPMVLLTFFSLPTVMATSGDTLYIKKKKKKLKPSKADYFRIIIPDSLSTRFVVNDYHLSGELFMTGVFKTKKIKKKDGEFKWYYKSGKLEKIENYSDNLLNGVTSRYSKDGAIDYKGVYQNGVRSDEWFYYFENGNTSAKIRYTNGEISSEDYWNADASLVLDKEKANFEPKYLGGGIEEFKTNLYKLTNYPEHLIMQGVQGEVKVTFTIDSRGKLKDYKISKSAHPDLDKEVLIAMEKLSEVNWIPGKRYNRHCSFKYVVPMKFWLE